MKVNFLKISAATALVASGSTQAALWTSPVSHYLKTQTQLSDFSDVSKKGVGGVNTDIIYRPTFTLSSRYAFTPDIRHSLNWREGYKNKVKVSHDRFEVNLVDKQAGEYVGHNWEVQYSFKFPTTLADQQEGRVGQFAVRPATTLNYANGFSTVVRNTFAFPIQRYVRQKFIDRNALTAAVKGNPFYINALELLTTTPELGVQGLNVGVVFANVNKFMGSGTSSKNFWNSYLDQDLSINYTSAAIDNYELALGTAYRTLYGQSEKGVNNKTTWWKNTDVNVYFEVAKGF